MNAPATFQPARQLLRHILATIAYRGGKAIRKAPPEFATYRPAPGSRAPIEILAHLGDLFDWATSICAGKQVWSDATPGSWDSESSRFHHTLKTLDDYLASDAELHADCEKLFQGPLADALTHIGQLTYLRRLSGAPIRGENYFRADIRTGTLGPDQPAPKREFD